MARISLFYPVGHTARITQRFNENPGVYKKFKLAGHNGLDYGVSSGTPVKAAEAGKVKKVSFDPDGYGNYVHLEHDNGRFETLYAHLSSYTTGVGRTVKRGETIGYSGNTGFSTGPHLHFELRVPTQKRPGYPRGAQDPMPHFAAVGSGYVPPGPVTVPSGYVKAIAPAGLHIRQKPNMSGKIVGTLPNGMVVKKDGVRGEWVAIILYVHSSWIE